jgi:hypothetical protein
LQQNLRNKWVSLPRETLFLHKMRHITRFYKQFNKQKTKEHKMEELNAMASLEIATTRLQEDIYNVEKQGEVNQYKSAIE